MDSQFTERSAAFLFDMCAQIQKQLVAHGVKNTKAEAIAHDTCNQLRQSFGGEQFYFPKGKDYDAMMKHHQIYKEFTGNNHAQLAKKFNVSVIHVYRIINKLYKQELTDKQAELF